MSRKKRTLAADEEGLWRKVTADVNAYRPLTEPSSATRHAVKKTTPARTPHRPLKKPTAPMKPALSAAPSLAVSVDRHFDKRIRRGRTDIDGRIDLHGMTQAEAHGALAGFIASAYEAGKRCVLVITGKGARNTDERPLFAPERGVLRRRTPEWLSHAPLRPMVAAIAPAHARHGGEGALYVYLRKKR
ncbi:MAG: Smr/MutS family protein [Pseudomonadota bacterium]